MKIEAHTERTEPGYQGNVLSKFHGKAVATESVKVMADVDEIHSAPSKNDLLLPDFYLTDVFVTWPTVCSRITLKCAVNSMTFKALGNP